MLPSLKLTHPPWKQAILKGKVIFRPSIFRCKLAVSFKEDQDNYQLARMFLPPFAPRQSFVAHQRSVASNPVSQASHASQASGGASSSSQERSWEVDFSTPKQKDSWCVYYMYIYIYIYISVSYNDFLMILYMFVGFGSYQASKAPNCN